MEKVVRVCDRCGKQITERAPRIGVVEGNKKFIIDISFSDVEGLIKNDFDLCDSCLIEILQTAITQIKGE